jgi:hypothetical protein
MTSEEILDLAKATILRESEAVASLTAQLDEGFCGCGARLAGL